MKTKLAVKRLMDIVGAVVGIVIGLPICCVAAIFVKLDSNGPVFYVQKRIGKGGRIIRLYKIRTMVEGADKYNWNLLTKNPKDNRITKVGRILRALSIDEIPQFINVLLGHMSLVGPRSFTPEEICLIPENYYLTSIRVKPGITGLWQVNGRSKTDFQKRMELDTHYVQNWSIPLDLWIICKTFWVVFKREGAY